MKKRIISLGTFLLLAGSLLAQIPFAYTVKGELSDSAFHGKEIAIICGVKWQKQSLMDVISSLAVQRIV